MADSNPSTLAAKTRSVLVKRPPSRFTDNRRIFSLDSFSLQQQDQRAALLSSVQSDWSEELDLRHGVDPDPDESPGIIDVPKQSSTCKRRTLLEFFMFAIITAWIFICGMRMPIYGSVICKEGTRDEVIDGYNFDKNTGLKCRSRYGHRLMSIDHIEERIFNPISSQFYFADDSAEIWHSKSLYYFVYVCVVGSAVGGIAILFFLQCDEKLTSWRLRKERGAVVGVRNCFQRCRHRSWRDYPKLKVIKEHELTYMREIMSSFGVFLSQAFNALNFAGAFVEIEVPFLVDSNGYYIAHHYKVFAAFAVVALHGLSDIWIVLYFWNRLPTKIQMEWYVFRWHVFVGLLYFVAIFISTVVSVNERYQDEDQSNFNVFYTYCSVVFGARSWSQMIATFATLGSFTKIFLNFSRIRESQEIVMRKFYQTILLLLTLLMSFILYCIIHLSSNVIPKCDARNEFKLYCSDPKFRRYGLNIFKNGFQSAFLPQDWIRCECQFLKHVSAQAHYTDAAIITKLAEWQMLRMIQVVHTELNPIQIPMHQVSYEDLVFISLRKPAIEKLFITVTSKVTVVDISDVTFLNISFKDVSSLTWLTINGVDSINANWADLCHQRTRSGENSLIRVRLTATTVDKGFDPCIFRLNSLKHIGISMSYIRNATGDMIDLKEISDRLLWGKRLKSLDLSYTQTKGLSVYNMFRMFRLKGMRSNLFGTSACIEKNKDPSSGNAYYDKFVVELCRSACTSAGGYRDLIDRNDWQCDALFNHSSCEYDGWNVTAGSNMYDCPMPRFTEEEFNTCDEAARRLHNDSFITCNSRNMTTENMMCDLRCNITECNYDAGLCLQENDCTFGCAICESIHEELDKNHDGLFVPSDLYVSSIFKSLFGWYHVPQTRIYKNGTCVETDAWFQTLWYYLKESGIKVDFVPRKLVAIATSDEQRNMLQSCADFVNISKHYNESIQTWDLMHGINHDPNVFVLWQVIINENIMSEYFQKDVVLSKNYTAWKEMMCSVPIDGLLKKLGPVIYPTHDERLWWAQMTGLKTSDFCPYTCGTCDSVHDEGKGWTFRDMYQGGNQIMNAFMELPWLHDDKQTRLYDGYLCTPGCKKYLDLWHNPLVESDSNPHCIKRLPQYGNCSSLYEYRNASNYDPNDCGKV